MPLLVSEPLAYRIKDAARLLSVTPNHLYNLVASGHVPSVRLGRSILIPRAALVALLSGTDQHARDLEVAASAVDR